MQDKIHLLMEETGCDLAQAEIAMSLAGYDLEKAIRAIGVLLRHIVAAKGKFQDPSKNLYGLLIAIADTRREQLVRVRAVVSYNPSLYETPLTHNWFDFEKSLYASRLGEGTLQQVSQDLERAVTESVVARQKDFFAHVGADGVEGLESFLRDVTGAAFRAGAGFAAAFSREVLNLDQFKRLPATGEDLLSVVRPALGHPGGDSLALSVDLIPEPEGMAVEDIRPGDSAPCRVVDARDIAQYLSKLLGAEEKAPRPFEAPIEEVRPDGPLVKVQLRLSTGIIGLAEAPRGARFRVARHAAEGARRWFLALRFFIPLLKTIFPTKK